MFDFCRPEGANGCHGLALGEAVHSIRIYPSKCRNREKGTAAQLRAARTDYADRIAREISQLGGSHGGHGYGHRGPGAVETERDLTNIFADSPRQFRRARNYNADD